MAKIIEFPKKIEQEKSLPKSVKIGIYDYEVEETDDILLVGGQQCVGLISYDELKIRIDAERPLMRKEHTLAHEIVHGIVIEYDIPITEELLEETVDKFATGILQVLKDNPELFRK